MPHTEQSPVCSTGAAFAAGLAAAAGEAVAGAGVEPKSPPNEKPVEVLLLVLLDAALVEAALLLAPNAKDVDVDAGNPNPPSDEDEVEVVAALVEDEDAEVEAPNAKGFEKLVANGLASLFAPAGLSSPPSSASSASPLPPPFSSSWQSVWSTSSMPMPHTGQSASGGGGAFFAGAAALGAAAGDAAAELEEAGEDAAVAALKEKPDTLLVSFAADVVLSLAPPNENPATLVLAGSSFLLLVESFSGDAAVVDVDAEVLAATRPPKPAKPLNGAGSLELAAAGLLSLLVEPKDTLVDVLGAGEDDPAPKENPVDLLSVLSLLLLAVVLGVPNPNTLFGASSSALVVLLSSLTLS